MIAYNVIVLLALLVIAIVALVNVLGVRSLRPDRVQTPFPLVSVLVPARNEERTIGRTLDSLAAQDYEQLEILVLDDGSEDGTAAEVERRTGPGSRIRLLRGQPLPEGWTGKNFACHQLAEQARGDLLLFVDADTLHAPHSVRSGVADLQRTSSGLLTAIPRQRMEGFWERVVIPLLHYVTFCFLPVPLVSLVREPRLAMANGQYMLWRRDVYRELGGHAAVRSALVEDVWLARRVKAAGHTLTIRYGGEAVSCRMYTSLGGIWEGFSKNLFAGFGYSLAGMAGVFVFNLATSVLPFLGLAVLAALGTQGTEVGTLVTAQVVAVIGIRMLLALRFDQELWSVMLHPMAMVVLLGIVVNSVRWVLAAGGARWKGRVYDFHIR